VQDTHLAIAPFETARLGIAHRGPNLVAAVDLAHVAPVIACQGFGTFQIGGVVLAF